MLDIFLAKSKHTKNNNKIIGFTTVGTFSRTVVWSIFFNALNEWKDLISENEVSLYLLPPTSWWPTFSSLEKEKQTFLGEVVNDLRWSRQSCKERDRDIINSWCRQDSWPGSPGDLVLRVKIWYNSTAHLRLQITFFLVTLL